MSREEVEAIEERARGLVLFLNDPRTLGNPEDHYEIVRHLQEIRDLATSCLNAPAYGEFRDERGYCNTYEEEFSYKHHPLYRPLCSKIS